MAKKNGLVGNLAWKFAERISAQLVTTVVSVILARLLDPSDHGLISIVMIFITLANVFVSDGLASALIQKKDADALDFSSFLYFNIAVSLGLYLILYFAAPYISMFYGEGYEILTPILRILGLRIILTSVNSVQHAYVSKKMMFNKFFWATLIGTVVSAAVGVYMAYSGFGVWALVAQYLVSTSVSTVTLMLVIRKVPLLAFSFERIKGLLGYGSKILGSGLLVTGFQELRALMIGKLYSSSDLAFYDKGRHFPNLIIANVNTSISSVLFPKMSNEQDDIGKVKNTTRNSIRFGSFILCPMMLGLAAVAEQFVTVFLTEKWLPSVPLMQLFCIIYLFQPIHTANIQALKALGKSGVCFWLETIKKAIELVVLLITMWLGVDAIVIGMAVLATLFTFVNAYPNIKLLKYTIKEQMSDILPSIISSVIMAAVVLAVGRLPVDALPLLIVQVLVGATVYILLAIMTKNKEFKYIIGSIRSMFAKIKKPK